MEIRVLAEYYNPVMKRKEMKIEVSHVSAGTPDRFSTRKALAERLNAKLENLFVTNMVTGTGTQGTICNIELYDDQRIAERIIPNHIRTRNLPSEERKVDQEKGEKKEAKAAESKIEVPAKKEEKPSEKTLEKPAETPEGKKAGEKPADKKAEKKTEKKESKKEAPKRTEVRK